MKKGITSFATVSLLLLSACASESGSSSDSDTSGCPAVGDLTVTETNTIGVGMRCLIGGTLTQSATLPASSEWFIDGFIAVGDGNSSPELTIEPGTHVRGDRPSASAADYVYISPGASLTAIGSRSAPILFTSNDDNFDISDAGDPPEWGGLIIADTAAATFGANQLEYVIVAEGGAEVTVNNKTYSGNIVLDGLHDDTYLLFVQSHDSAMDGISLLSDEAPNQARIGWLLVTGASRDGLSYDNYSGLVKNLLVIHRPNLFDESTGLGGRAGIFASGVNSHPLFVNVSLIGRDTNSVASITAQQREFGLVFDGGTEKIRIANMLIANFRNGCYEIAGGANLSAVEIDGADFIDGDSVVDGVHCGHEDTNTTMQIRKVLSGGDIPDQNGLGLTAHSAGPIDFNGEMLTTFDFTLKWLLEAIGGFDNTPLTSSSLVSELSTFNNGDTDNSGVVATLDKNFQPFLGQVDIFYSTVSGVPGNHLGYDLTRIGAVVSSAAATTDPFNMWTLHSDFGEFKLDGFDP